MVMHSRKFSPVICNGFYLVNSVVFLSLISCTAIHGKNASIDTAKDSSRFSGNSTKTIEGLPNAVFHFPFRSNRTETQMIPKERSPGSRRSVSRRQTEEEVGPCRSFVMDVAVRNEFEFYNPGRTPNQPYPSQTDCVKTITAPPGFLLRLDFRDEFHLEQSEDCRFDYLEIRDGAHGYSNLIGSFCGNKHPPPITSSDRHLWLRFSSDENIQYSGFTAVYWFIPRPTNDQHPEMDTCQIEVSGNEGFANRSDIDEDRVRFSTTYGLPLDCMWIISVEQGWKIMLQFLKFRLEKPNDCESNFVDVFSDRTDLPSRLKNFCGSIADSVISKSNVLHLRFFAETRSINSTFEALFTAFRDKARDEACDEDEYDCEDATCISIDLRCNGRINCRFRWDEDECQPKLGAFAVILESEHIIIILVVFCLILSGMCFAFLFNCTKKLVRDHRIIQEHLKQSKEKELNEIVRKERPSGAEPTLEKIAPALNHARSRSGSSSGSSLRQESVKLSPIRNRSVGDVVPILDGRKAKNRGSESDVENLELATLPEMRDSECQTRESLFSTETIDFSDAGPPRRPRPGDAPPFSTFGYAAGEERRRQGFAGPRVAPAADGKRYKAEAVIEVKKEDSAGSDVRPFSIDSTKSAPDVIVTH